MSCKVKTNCKNPWECWSCVEYGMYSPIDKNIKSPRQEKAKKGRQETKKILKNSDASIRGKANRNAGKRAENDLVKLLTSWGLDVKKVALSGALKATGLVGGEDMYKGDIKLTLDGEMLDIESKRHQSANTDKVVNKIITDFCWVMPEKVFHAFLLGIDPVLTALEDKGIGWLHKFFDQDDSHIVAIKKPYQDWVFAVRTDTINKLKGVLNEI